MNNNIVLKKIDQIVGHYVGNKNNGEGISFSNTILAKEKIELDVITLFQNSFSTNDVFYEMYFEPIIELNPIYNFVSLIFDNNNDFLNQSQNCAKHLYEQSTHPKIKGGEFYTVYFKDCILDGDTVDAVGLFKSENKDTFLKVLHKNNSFNLESEKGINIKKLDKGCLIFNKGKENGYVVAVVDNTNRGIEAQYWIDDFLHIRQRKDEYANTQNIMSLTKDFVTKELPAEFEVTKADQIDLLNKSLKFFKEKDTFDIEEFANEVIEQPEVIEKFHQYKRAYEEESQIAIDDQFTISESARKKQQRSYKRVIRLDQKIQIIIDGNRDNVEQGEDERGKFYKVYYRQEM